MPEQRAPGLPEPRAPALRGLPRAAIALAAVAAIAGARAETSGVSPTGFMVTHRIEVKATPARVFEALGQIGRWWNVEHSYSGEGRNLSLDLQAGGCFCERWAGGSVQHLQVVYVDRAKHAVRLLGGLGPLQGRAVHAVMGIDAAAAEGRTVLTLTYRVFGPSDVGLDQSAAPVDGVLGDAAKRLAAFAEGAKP